SVDSIDEEVAQEYEFDVPLTWNDLLSLDTDDSPQQAMRKLDWDAFTRSLDKRMQKILQRIAGGRTLRLEHTPFISQTKQLLKSIFRCHTPLLPIPTHSVPLN
ncbi:MAG: hypothetical protein ACO1QB_17425, partial [Verrucomicrobiales bacterium]